MEKINIAEILKDCPKGMELDSPLFGDVYFDSIDDVCDIIKCYIQDSTKKIGISFNKYGCYSSISKSKCVIFPKGKTTWEGLQRFFKDGDIVATTNGSWIGITEKGEKGRFIPTYCVIKSNGKFEAYLDAKERWSFKRLATEEEKQKLFDAIKENGYKWNAETKTLENLVEPKFKVGDRIKNKNSGTFNKVIKILEDCYLVEGYLDERFTIDFDIQDNWELVPNKFDITTLNPFDKVLVRLNNDNQWYATWFSHIDEKYESYGSHYVTVAGKSYTRMIPYKCNEHLLGKTDDCDEYYKTWE